MTRTALQKSLSPNYSVGSVTGIGDKNMLTEYTNQLVPNIYEPFFVGFDRIFDELSKVPMMKNINYPPYNIRKVDDLNYVIEIAVAGFDKNEIDINLEDSLLVVTGTKSSEDTMEYLHKGISNRDFKREYKLADTVEVQEANMKDGILTIMLKNHIPEHKLPKKINIS
jgi:molecular chaperone IbpA